MGNKQHHYFTWREEIILTHPHIIYLPNSAPLCDISKWSKELHIEYTWHLSRFNIFDFESGYDFFFKQLKDAATFKLTWGGELDTGPPLQFELFYF